MGLFEIELNSVITMKCSDGYQNEYGSRGNEHNMHLGIWSGKLLGGVDYFASAPRASFFAAYLLFKDSVSCVR